MEGNKFEVMRQPTTQETNRIIQKPWRYWQWQKRIKYPLKIKKLPARCFLCNGAHFTTYCPSPTVPASQRYQLIIQNNHCPLCLYNGHQANNCRRRNFSQCSKCDSKFHHTLLHNPNYQQKAILAQENSSAPPAVSTAADMWISHTTALVNDTPSKLPISASTDDALSNAHIKCSMTSQIVQNAHSATSEKFNNIAPSEKVNKNKFNLAASSPNTIKKPK